MNDPKALHTAASTLDYRGRIVLITGGGKGIGRCLVASFARAKAKVYFADCDREAGLETQAWLGKEGHDASFIEADVSDEADVNALLKASEKEGLDLLINNAGMAAAGAAHVFSQSVQEFDRMLSTNLRGPFIVTRRAVSALEKRQGNVINIASTRALMSEAKTEGYAAAKGGLVSLTHALALSLGDRGIRVNCISPGWIDTSAWQKGFPSPARWSQKDHQQHPVGRIGQPADIAAACLYLGSPAAGFISGENLIVDGGMTRKMIYEE